MHFSRSPPSKNAMDSAQAYYEQHYSWEIFLGDGARSLARSLARTHLSLPLASHPAVAGAPAARPAVSLPDAPARPCPAPPALVS